MDLGAARERVRVARALGALPQLAEALARRELSYAKVRALTRVATPETEARLLEIGTTNTAEHIERRVRSWRQSEDRNQSTRRHYRRTLEVYRDADGMIVLTARLDPETGEVFLKGLEAAREALYQRRRRAVINTNVSAETAPTDSEGGVAPEFVHEPLAYVPSFPQQQVDALRLLVDTALHHGLDAGPPGERYQIVVHVDAESLAETARCADGKSALDSGARISGETSRRLACDATRVVMRHAEDGHVTEIGARTRAIPPALRRALEHRDGGCRFPGCGLPYGQGHHIRHWAHGGPTTLSNLVLLCRRHHRCVHEERYEIEQQPNGELRFRRPDGELLPDVPPPVV